MTDCCRTPQAPGTMTCPAGMNDTDVRSSRKSAAAHRTLVLPAAAVLLIISGCGTDSSEEYVDFRETSEVVPDNQDAGPAETESGDSVVPESDGAAGNPAGPSLPEIAPETASSSEGSDSIAAGSDATPEDAVADASAETDERPEEMPRERVDPLPPEVDGVLGTAAPGEAREIKVLIPRKRFRREGPEKAYRVSYDDLDLLKVLNMDPVPADAVDYFPDWLKQLDGQRIRIRGFMFPTFTAEGLTSFKLARDNDVCCFVRVPLIYDVFGVELAEGVTTDYIEGRPFDVEGTFHIDPQAGDSGLYRLYRIDNAVVVR